MRPIYSGNYIFVVLGRITFTEAEKEFLNHNEACRIATCHDNIPHVVPVSYVFEDDAFIIATDYETKKYENISKNNKVALTVDVYNSVDNKAVCVQGEAIIIEKGKEFEKFYNTFHDRFEWVKREPWKEGEAPFIKIIPIGKVSWGI
jgi:nitroimidazol reductase NimA-like FMN-containing flavoprotein (pyridoxamine 5'-phosphate oxidase superfamily)